MKLNSTGAKLYSRKIVQTGMLWKSSHVWCMTGCSQFLVNGFHFPSSLLYLVLIGLLGCLKIPFLIRVKGRKRCYDNRILKMIQKYIDLEFSSDLMLLFFFKNKLIAAIFELFYKHSIHLIYITPIKCISPQKNDWTRVFLSTHFVRLKFKKIKNSFNSLQPVQRKLKRKINVKTWRCI